MDPMAKLKLIESFMTVLQSAGVFAVSDVSRARNFEIDTVAHFAFGAVNSRWRLKILL